MIDPIDDRSPRPLLVGRDPSAARDPDAKFLRTLTIGGGVIVLGIIVAMAVMPTDRLPSIATRPTTEAPQDPPAPPATKP